MCAGWRRQQEQDASCSCCRRQPAPLEEMDSMEAIWLPCTCGRRDGQHGGNLAPLHFACSDFTAGVVAFCRIRADVPMTAARLVIGRRAQPTNARAASHLGLVMVVQGVRHGDQGNHWLGVAQQPLSDDPPGHDGSHQHLAPQQQKPAVWDTLLGKGRPQGQREDEQGHHQRGCPHAQQCYRAAWGTQHQGLSHGGRATTLLQLRGTLQEDSLKAISWITNNAEQGGRAAGGST